MSALLQISDPHFGTERPRVVAALLRFASALAPDVLLLSGDITQRARASQFAAARAFFDRLDVPVKLSIPGNHDIPLFNLWARALTPYANYRRGFGEQLEPTHESEELLLICLNTTHPARRKNGKLEKEQIERVSARLRLARRSQLRVVAMHHPMYVIKESDRGNIVRGHAEAAEAWARAGVDIVVGGHIHLPYVKPLKEEHAHLLRPIWAVQAGTAVSKRVRGEQPNSVNVIRYAASGAAMNCVVERWDYERASNAFKLSEVYQLPLHREGLPQPAAVV